MVAGFLRNAARTRINPLAPPCPTRAGAGSARRTAGQRVRGDAHAQFVEDRLQVILDGVDGDAQPVGDLGRGQALGHELSDLALARRELLGSQYQRRDFSRTRLLQKDRRLRFGARPNQA